MIDSTKAPVPLWRRYLTTIVITVVAVAACGFVYMKDFRHHPAASKAPSGPPPVLQQAPSGVPTTVPGGVAVSGRNIFG